MKQNNKFNVLYAKQIILEGKSSPIKLELESNGVLKLSSLNKNITGSFAFDTNTNNLKIKKLTFRDDDSFLSSANSFGENISGKFDLSSGRLLEVYAPDDYSAVKANSLKGSDAYNRFDWNNGGILNELYLSDSLKQDITKGVSAANKFGADGKLLDANIRSGILDDITKGVGAANKFGADGKLLDANIRSGLIEDITKGVTAHEKFDVDGKLLDSHIRSSLLDDITKGVGAANKFGADGKLLDSNIRSGLIDDITKGVGAANKFGADGKLLDSHIRSGILDDITKGVGAASKFGPDGKLFETNLELETITKITNGNSAHNDLNQSDVSIDVNGNIKFNRGGSRGISTGITITKSHVGLGLAENKSAATIVGETFNDVRFISISSSARDGFFSGSQARDFFDNSSTPQIKDANTPSGLKNSNITVDSSTGKLVGIGTLDIVVNNEKTFSDNRFTAVQSTANSANTLSNAIDGRFTDGLLNVANAATGLRNSNITVDGNGALQGIGTGVGTVVNNNSIGISQASDGTITITRGSGLSNLTANPLSTTTFTAVQTTANNANTLSNAIDGRFSGGKLLETNLESTTIIKIANGNTAHSDLNSADVSIDASGKIQFNRGGSRGLSTGATVTKSHIGLPLVENKSVSTIKSETFSDSTFTTLQTTANSANTLSNTIESRFTSGRLKSLNLPDEQSAFRFTSSKKIKMGASLGSYTTDGNNTVEYDSDSDIEIITGSSGIPDIAMLKAQPAGNLTLGQINFKGWNGAVFTTAFGQANKQNYNTRATIDSKIDVNGGGSLNFSTAEGGEWEIGLNNSPDSPVERMTLNNLGNLGIGIDPGNVHRIYINGSQADYIARIRNTNTAGAGLIIAAGAGGATLRTLVSFRQSDNTIVGRVTHTNGTVSYEQFTGAHRVYINDNLENYKYGTILKVINSINTGSFVAYNGIMTTTSYDKSAIGVFVSSQTIDNEEDSLAKGSYLVNALGDGHILVCNQGGNIEIGDYICSSDTSGVGMKQNDDIIHSYTVAKSTQNVNWSEHSSSVLLITCTYHSA